MCGLVGMMGDFTNKHREAMKDLLFLDTLRGADSTGLASVHRNRQVELRKLTVPGYEFISMPHMSTLLNTGDQLWLGHNRFRTRGNVNRINAHPFQIVDDEGYITLVGAHNGTLENTSDVEKELEDNSFGTDSEALLNLINRDGPKKAIAVARGAWSLVWWDAAEDQLCFLRNDKRPMVYAFSKDRRVLIWASEAWMLLAAAGRHGIELEQDANGIACRSTSVDTLYRFDIPQKFGVKLEEPVKEGGLLGAAEKVGFSSHTTFWSGLEDDAKSKTNQKDEKEGSSTGQKNVISLHSGGSRGYNNNPLSVIARNQIAAKGCVWCGANLKSTQMAFVSEAEAVCPSHFHTPTSAIFEDFVEDKKKGVAS